MLTASCYMVEFEFKRTQELGGIILLREDQNGLADVPRMVWCMATRRLVGKAGNIQTYDFGVGGVGEGYGNVRAERARC